MENRWRSGLWIPVRWNFLAKFPTCCFRNPETSRNCDESINVLYRARQSISNETNLTTTASLTDLFRNRFRFQFFLVPTTFRTSREPTRRYPWQTWCTRRCKPCTFLIRQNTSIYKISTVNGLTNKDKLCLHTPVLLPSVRCPILVQSKVRVN